MNTNQPPDNPEQKHSVEPTAAIDQISGCPPIEVFREPDLPCTAPRSISRNPAKGTGKSGGKGSVNKTLRVSSTGTGRKSRKKKPKKLVKKWNPKRGFQK